MKTKKATAKKATFRFTFNPEFPVPHFEDERAQGFLRSVRTVTPIVSPQDMSKDELVSLALNPQKLADLALINEIGKDRVEYELNKFDSSIEGVSDALFDFYFLNPLNTHETVELRASKVEFYIALAKRVIQTGGSPQKRQGKKAPQKRQIGAGEKRVAQSAQEFSEEFKSFLISKGFKENARGFRGKGEIIENTSKGFKTYFKNPLSPEDKHTKADLYTGTHTEDEIREYLNK